MSAAVSHRDSTRKRRAGERGIARPAVSFAGKSMGTASAIPTGQESEVFCRSPGAVETLRPLLRAVNAYFGTEVRGWESLPRAGPFLIVGNHSGGAETIDLAFILGKWVETRGARAPLYALAYDLMFNYPIVGSWLPRIGIIPANHKNAREALGRNAAVVVFPGGDYEVFRPWSARNRIEFGGHEGFIKLALSTGVPVVPLTIHGAHQSTLVLTRGRQLARWMGLTRLHVHVFPLIWNIPLGLTPAFIPSLQLPSKVTVAIDEPLDWSHYGPGSAEDAEVRSRCYAEITRRMQHTLNRLALERPHPVLARLGELRQSRTVGGAVRGRPRGRGSPAGSLHPPRRRNGFDRGSG